MSEIFKALELVVQFRDPEQSYAAGEVYIMRGNDPIGCVTERVDGLTREECHEYVDMAFGHTAEAKKDKDGAMRDRIAKHRATA